MLSQGASVYASEIAPSQPVLSERPIRVMVVDDSAVVRGLVSRWVDEEPGLKVVARHANGKLAVEDVVRSAPDIVLLDIEMPVMDGLEALPLLLRARPGLRVLMVSTLTQRNAEISFKALALGAIDYVPKPDTNREITIQPDFRREVIEKIKVLGPLGLRRKGAEVPDFGTAAQLEGGEKSRAFRQRAFSLVPPRVIAIGSSTGGPQALGSLLGALSPSLSRLAVLVAQHMPPMFTTVLAERLARATGREAREGRDGEPLKLGSIYVAPGDHHMTVARQEAPCLRIRSGPPGEFLPPRRRPALLERGVDIRPRRARHRAYGHGQRRRGRRSRHSRGGRQRDRSGRSLERGVGHAGSRSRCGCLRRRAASRRDRPRP